CYGLCFALWWSGRLRQCLEVAEEGQGLTQGALGLGADQVGFSPSLGFSFYRAFVVSLTGRPRDGAVELDRVIELARASQQLVPIWVAHNFHVFRCSVTGEAAAALSHAREAMDYAERTANEHGRISAYYSLGFANALDGAWQDALVFLERALAIGRERRLQA